MEAKEFSKLLDTDSNQTKQQGVALKKILKDYPYFQAGWAMYLKVLREQKSHQYNSVLKRCAARTTDRSVLLAKIGNEKTAKKVENSVEDVVPGSPLEFDMSEMHSFSEWLSVTKARPINRSEKSNEKSAKTIELIDQFLASNPKIKPSVSNNKQENLVKDQKIDPQEMMTETLARVYWEQKKYKKALQAYKILRLKYPEKSGFFADQIRAIKKSIEKNKKI